MSPLTTRRPQHGRGFSHEALFYEGQGDFVTRVGAFLRDGARGGEAALAVVSAEKIAMLREELGPDARVVRFADMAEVGANPSRIIPAWRRFLDEHLGDDAPVRGVGEPIWAARPADELGESERHEALLNVAFAGTAPWRLLCPYDTTSLPTTVLDVARRNHPMLDHGGGPSTSERYPGVEALAGGALAEDPADPLPPPPPGHDITRFDLRRLSEVRRVVAGRATDFGLGERADDLVLAVLEMATNSVRHGGGSGTLAMWATGDTFVCEVRDAGHITDPLVGRVPPTPDRPSGYGIWIAHQLCDLVQIRTGPAGSVVRIHVRRR